MAITLGKLKCYFCRGKEGLFHSVHEYGVYGDVGQRIFYHLECLQMVQLNPTQYGHRWADKAINISELEQENRKKCNENLVEEFEKKVEKLHRFHFQRMLPRKR